MKKKVFCIVALAIALFAQAKNYTIVIRGTRPSNIGQSVVQTKEDPQTDTLTVLPATDVEYIFVSLKNSAGEVVESYVTSARCEDQVSVITPFIPQGYILQIRDDKGLVYEDITY